MLNSALESKVIRGLMLALCLFATSFALAGEEAGTVLSSRGTVSAGSTGQQRPLKEGDYFFVNDRIATADKSFVVLQLLDGARVTLFADSAVLIESYRYHQTERDAAILSLQSGGLRIIAGAMARSNPEGFKVRTPVALMVVRGPEFAVMLCGEQICTENETQN